MIHYIKVRNFMSFKDEVCLDFEATDDKRLEDYHVVEMADGTRLLRFAVLYGANASGKSNLVKVFDFLKAYWTNKDGKDISSIPFLFDNITPLNPTEFELALYIGSYRYEYHLKIMANTTIHEELFLDDAGELISIIKRERIGKHSKFTINPKIIKFSKTVIEIFSANCLDYMSFFAARYKVNIPDFPHFDNVWEWTAINMIPPIATDSDPNDLNEYWESRLSEDDDIRKYIIDYVRKADFNIINIESKTENVAKKQDIMKIKTLFTHNITCQNENKQIRFPTSFQSNGTIRTVAIGVLLYDAHKYNAFVAIDEIETSLHPELVEFIIGQFLEEEPNRSQMLITTHYAKLLDTVDDILRRDSVWFVEKQENGSSELYSLIEFEGVDDMDHLHGAYMNGRFGALPHLKY